MGKDWKATKIQELVYDLKVNQVMTKDVITISPKMNMSELREILRVNCISGVPVTEKGKLVGMVSIEDFLKWLGSEQEDCPVIEKMTSKVETVFGDSSLVEAVSKFDKFGFGRLPVISRNDRKIAGIITKGDIVKGTLKKLEVEYNEEDIYAYRASHIFEDILADKAVLTFEYGIKGKDFKHAGECASNLKKTLKRLGFHSRIIRRVAIATYEAEMNIVIYTERGDIIAEVESDRLKIKVMDVGPGIEDIEQAMRPGYSTAPEWVRELGFGAGMGLCNIKRCSDKMSLASVPAKGTKIEMDFNLNRK